MRKIVLILALALIFLGSIAHAEVFKWVDEKGGVHFTEDPATIPEKYRERVQSRPTEEDSMSIEERVRGKKKHEEEVREQLKKDGREHDAKELEERAKKQREEGKCEIVSFSQFERNLGGKVIGGGDVRGHVDSFGSFSGSVDPGVVIERIDTCVDIVIQNNGSEAKTIQSGNIIAVTRKGKTVTPKKGVFISIGPGLTYRGNICFGQHLSQIVKMELRGL
jgi:hypothetical protein